LQRPHTLLQPNSTLLHDRYPVPHRLPMPSVYFFLEASILFYHQKTSVLTDCASNVMARVLRFTSFSSHNLFSVEVTIWATVLGISSNVTDTGLFFKLISCKISLLSSLNPAKGRTSLSELSASTTWTLFQ